MENKILYILLAVTIALFSSASFADGKSIPLNTDNCKASKWFDADGNNISIEDKFGPGAMAVTHCLANTKKLKILYQMNTMCKNSACTAAYAAGNIQNHINDLTITHGLDADDYVIAVVMHSGAWKLTLNNDAVDKHPKDNPFQAAMEKLIATPSVNVYFCQNTAAKKGVSFANMIPGIGFVTAGVSAISDFQESGFNYIQP